MPATLPSPGARARARARAPFRVGVLVLLALVAGACGGGEQSAPEESPEATPSVALPTGDVEVPDDVELTPAGTELAFGETASVAYQVGEGGSVVELTVLGARAGKVADLSAYQLDEATRKSRPYYVRVRVANAGTGQLGGAAVPLFAVDGRNTLVQPSTFTSPFKRCPSTRLPARFGADARTTTCLVYLLPDKGTLEAVSYRPLQSFEPITWGVG